MTSTTTETLHLPDVDLVYDVHGPVPTADGRPLLFMIGQPMQADGFADLAAQFPDRTVVTYDPRGLGRSSTRRDGRNDQRPEDQAADLPALRAHPGQGLAGREQTVSLPAPACEQPAGDEQRDREDDAGDHVSRPAAAGSRPRSPARPRGGRPAPRSRPRT
mgnify:CR=1 FL=1